MDSIIQILKESNNELLKNESKGIEWFKTLKHTQKDLSTFLRYSVAEVLLSNGNTKIVCTMNAPLIKKFVESKQENRSTKPNLAFLKNPNNSIAWDLVRNNTTVVRGKDWQILNFIVIEESNIDILHKSIEELLHK